MKIETYKEPKSSFLSVEKDLEVICDKIVSNKRLQKLLCNQDKNCISPGIPSPFDEGGKIDLVAKGYPDKDHGGISLYMIDNGYLKIVPKLYVDEEAKSYIVISFDNFVPNATNPAFRDNVIEFDIICHFANWQLDGFDLRPFKIAAEIDSMFNNTHLSGIGTLEFLASTQTVLNENLAGIVLLYSAVHGEDDKNILQPATEGAERFQKMVDDFDEREGNRFVKRPWNEEVE